MYFLLFTIQGTENIERKIERTIVLKEKEILKFANRKFKFEQKYFPVASKGFGLFF